jgi:hypothetical protein
MRQFLVEINAYLEIKNLWLPKLQRKNDQFLMTFFWKAKETTAEILNNWRIYYKVILLSDICFGTGKGIQPLFLEYNHSTVVRQSSSSLNWPIQEKPDERIFKIWKRFLKQCFVNQDKHQISPLGPWDIKRLFFVKSEDNKSDCFTKNVSSEL